GKLLAARSSALLQWSANSRRRGDGDETPDGSEEASRGARCLGGAGTSCPARPSGEESGRIAAFAVLMLPAAATEQMPQFFLLRLQVFFRVFRGRDLAWYTLGYLDTGAFERSDFIRIIRQQANLVYVQRLQDLDWHEELALVGLEAKALIRFHRVKSAVLERVGLQFRHQPNAAALLLLIDQDACPQVSDHGECHFQLLAAVAAQRAKYVA